MRRLTAALVLALLFTVSTTAHVISPIRHVDPNLFRPVPEPSEVPIIVDSLGELPEVPKHPKISLPVPQPIIEPVQPVVTGFLLDPNVSWYGPHFYGKRTACGLALTKTLIGVANKTLPCGTKVVFKNGSHIVTAPVVDRGPYVAGRQWDLTGGLCLALEHCYTGPLYYKILR